MDDKKKAGRYLRIQRQLEGLLPKTEDPLARMATICAVLHHKMDDYFWTGFYLYKSDRLIVGPYQGPVACQELEKNKGVCWASLNASAPVVVPDVHTFPGHIACDSRSRSEITLPVFNQQGEITAIFDVDSDRPASFNSVDQLALTRILGLIHKAF
ncbi:MAG: GAF domain-containing protein [Bacteroidales bacterium]|nr:GAF domain-containing protein [Bacteroidales bacterium]